MMRFSDWLSSAWNLAKNIAGKLYNFIGKAAPMIGSFIGEAIFMMDNIGKFMSTLPGKLGTISKTITILRCFSKKNSLE
jgi:hypothetical protein